MTLDNDLLHEMHKQMQVQSQLLAHYLHLQLRKASETPGITKLTTINLWNPSSPPTAIQILTKNDKRETVAIANAGPADVLIATKFFDPTTILQGFNDPNYPDAIVPGYNQMLEIGYLTSGQNLSIDGTAGIWAYSLGSTAGSKQNAILSFADSQYVTTIAEPGSEVEAFHLSGLHPSEMPGGGVVN